MINCTQAKLSERVGGIDENCVCDIDLCEHKVSNEIVLVDVVVSFIHVYFAYLVCYSICV